MLPLTPRVQRMLGNAVTEFKHGWDASIQKNFQVQGRPTKWLDTHRGGAILQNTARLRWSIKTDSVDNGSGSFTIIARTNNVAYARIHQYGGWIRAKGKKLAVPLTPRAAKMRPKDWPTSGKDKLFPVTTPEHYTLCIQVRAKGKKLAKKRPKDSTSGKDAPSPVKTPERHTSRIQKTKTKVEAQYVLKDAIFIKARPYLVIQSEDYELFRTLTTILPSE
jgi:phage gpG-like protein